MDGVEAILPLFDGYDCATDVINHGDNRGSLVLTIEGEDRRRSLAFMGHLDTVPVDDLDQWGVPPHEAVIEDGFVYGRGAADMKGGVTSMIQAALHVLQEGVTPAYSVKFCFTADEEANGAGVLSIRDAGLLDDVSAVFIPEPTGAKIGLMEKGALWLRVTADGKSAHGSRPDLGCNAIEELLVFLERLRGSIDLSIESDVFEQMGRSTFVIGQIEGGTKTNVVPAHASASVDIRTVFGVDHQAIIGKGEAIAAEMATDDLSISVCVENDRPAIGVDRDHPFVIGVAEEMEKLGLEVGYKGLHFYTDGSQVVPQLGIPFVILGPGEDSMAHQKDERVALREVSDVADVFISYILHLGEKEVFQ
jgi:succinyl-diaminopimelate desuccinylase